MLLSTAITGFLNMSIALASVAAFLISEAMDWLIYTYGSKSFIKRIILSNLISTPIDSLVFVVLAFGFMGPAVYGQSIVKYLSSLVVIPFILYARSRQIERQYAVEAAIE